MLLFGSFVVLIYIIVAIILYASLWIIYTKANQPGWSAIIPVYDIYIWTQVVNRPWWWTILFFIPPITIIVYIIMLNDLSNRFGQNAWFTLGLLFLPIIFLPVLAFGEYEFDRTDSNSAFD